MAKKVASYIKLQVPAGQANPSPPVGPALGQHGVNIMEFCKAFNAQTQGTEPGLPIPVVITVFADKSFTFITKTPPAAVLLRKAAVVSPPMLLTDTEPAIEIAVDAPLPLFPEALAPAPPAAAIPYALNPAPTKYPRSSGASPRMKFPSGVKASAPFTNWRMPTSANAGTRPIASSDSCWKCS